MDSNLTLRIDGLPHLIFYRGEDRSLSLALYDATQGIPIDLTGLTAASVTLPGSVYKVVRRYNQPLPLGATSAGTVAVAGHGLVTGDAVVFAGTTLPSPLVAGTVYQAQAVGKDSLGVMSSAGALLVLTGQPSTDATVSGPAELVVRTAQAGLLTLALRAQVTQACASGLCQALTLLVVIAGKTRIIAWPYGLDVV